VDLPLEEPLDAPAPPREPPTLVSAVPAAAPATAAAAPAKDLEQTDLNFIDPELFLRHDDPSGRVPIAPPAAPLEQPASLELALEDPVVDELLTSPVPTPPPAAAPPATLAAARPAPAAPEAPASAPGASRSASSDAQARAAARVPIARTAALTTAAGKLAAASAAHQQRFSDRARFNPASPVVPAARPAPPSTAAAPPKPADQPAARVGSSRVEAPRVEAPSFASWASARAATAPAVRPGSAPVAPAAAALAATPPPIPLPARSATPKAAASAPARPVPAQPAAAQTPAAPVSPPMDRDFVARNQVVERYLSGRLPLKGATDFERFCHQHPELLDEIGLPERVNAGLRLLEASGKPEPWQEAARPLWQKPQAILGLAAAALVLVVALALVAGDSAAKSHRITALQKQALERPLDPATSTREIRLLPSRSGASNTPAINIGGGSVQLADFKIDESRSPYHAFRVTIDRIDQGRVGVITNLTKDSNGHLRIALNSSALGPGNYQLTIEGLNWRGDAEPDSWITIGIVR
jgi:hypothetical protein